MIKRTSIFFCILGTILFLLNELFTPNWNYPLFSEKISMAIGEFIDSNEDIDVFFLGSSHIEYSVSPMQLYENNGIVSYNLGTSSQELDQTEYLIKEILKKRNIPNVIVLDASVLFYDSESEYSYRLITDSMPFDMNKMQLIEKYLDQKEYDEFASKEEEFFSYIFPFTKYHSRWESLSSADLTPKFEEKYFLQGFFPSSHIWENNLTLEEIDSWNQKIVDNQTKIKNFSWCAAQKVKIKSKEQYNITISSENKKILKNIKQLCDENGCELLLVKIPVNKAAVDYGSAWGTLRHNELLSTCDQLGIAFWDLNYENIGLDWKHDTVDGGIHLNFSGAKKTTDAIGAYLVNNYSISPKKNPNYEEKLRLYNQYKQVLGLELTYDFNDYLMLLKKYMSTSTIIISAKDDMILGLSSKEKRNLSQLGLNTDFDNVEYTDSLVVVLKNGTMEVESVSNREQSYVTIINGHDISIKSAGFLDGDISSIMIDDVEYSMNQRGLNFVVIDNESGLIIDKANCDTCAEEHEVHHDIGNLTFEYNEYLLGRK